jgi:hypothetical protein
LPHVKCRFEEEIEGVAAAAASAASILEEVLFSQAGTLLYYVLIRFQVEADFKLTMVLPRKY